MANLLSIAAAAAGLTGVAGAAAYAALSAESQWFGRTVTAPAGLEQLALTFDDGPNPAATPALLEVLARYGVRATFFVIGQHVRAEPRLTRAIAEAGHVLGNHTMTHPRMLFQGESFLRTQMMDCTAAIEDAAGTAVKLFRAPHGSRRPAVLRLARELGMTPVQWNLIVGDWKQRGAEDLRGRVERGIARNHARGQGTNLVLHDGSQHDARANRMATVEAVRGLLERKPAGREYVVPLELPFE